MENKRVILTETSEFKDAAKQINVLMAKEIADMVENGHGNGDDFAMAGLFYKLIRESVNVVSDLEFCIEELSNEIESLKKSNKVTG